MNDSSRPILLLCLYKKCTIQNLLLMNPTSRKQKSGARFLVPALKLVSPMALNNHNFSMAPFHCIPLSRFSNCPCVDIISSKKTIIEVSWIELGPTVANFAHPPPAKL